MIYPALPARPKDLPAPQGSAQTRRVFWLAFVILGVSTAMLTKYWPLLQLKN